MPETTAQPIPNRDGSYIGELRIFATPHTPKDWLECNGATFKVKDYPQLAKVIGNIWGSKTKDEFCLPDLRGVFLRGWNHGRTDEFCDPESGDRRLPVGAPGTAKDVVGSYQSDRVGPHTHTITAVNSWGDKWGGAAGWGYDNGKQNSSTIGTDAFASTETRPRNASVLYCIRAK